MRICKNEEIVESFDKYDLEVENDSTFIVEGCVVHNCNLRMIYKSDTKTFHVGSRNLWKKEAGNCLVWKAISSQREAVEAFCQAYPDHILYGEGYGWNKGFTYGATTAEPGFMAFDIMKPDRMFVNAETARSMISAFNIKQVPSFGVQPFDYDVFAEMIEKPSPYFPSNTCMEGVVVKPLIERQEKCGRLILKLVSNKYLEKS